MVEFLKLVTPEVAKDYFYSFVDKFENKTEIIETKCALGRVVALPIIASENIPAFPRSTVDGFAVLSKDTFGVSENLPGLFKVIGEVVMGQPAEIEIRSGEAAVIHTGGMLPKGADAVVMIENSQLTFPGEIEIMKSVGHNENVILTGEDVKEGVEVFTQGTLLRPGDIGALMSLGITKLSVFKLPRVGIVSSGDEIVDPEQKINVGQVRDINSYCLSALVQSHGGIPNRYGIVPDDKKKLTEVMKTAFVENDLIIVTAGSSASVRDLTAEVIDTIGKPGVLVHGVNVKPGKPTILAICDGKPIIGLPGNPVSAYVIASIFVVPLLRKIRGEKYFEKRQKLKGILTINVASLAGREDWIPVIVQEDMESGIKTIEPIFYKSNLIFSIIRADGFLRIPPDITGYSARTEVEIILI
ncbi:MAG: molybdopterin molybdenumtransferase MoeA [Chloroflexi bacterium HGW-Chloroflexi-8]|jgi:molybdopterin molybdotransferase|nr:MAG: molybdopterin molybdenumtransferase MoeA [Chloroflexi bacterium HGW-Chloroflexi-8]